MKIWPSIARSENRSIFNVLAGGVGLAEVYAQGGDYSDITVTDNVTAPANPTRSMRLKVTLQ